MGNSRKSAKAAIRIIVLTLSWLLIVPLCATETHAAATPSVQMESQYDFYSGEITVSLLLENNPGLICLRAVLNYDGAGLSLVRVTDKGLLKGFQSPAPGGETTNGEFILMWFDTSNINTNNTQNGCIAELVFEVKDFSAGKFDFLLEIDRKNTKNAEEMQLEFASATDSVRVPKTATLPSLIFAATYDNSGRMLSMERYDADHFRAPAEGKTYLFLLNNSFAPIGERFELIH